MHEKVEHRSVGKIMQRGQPEAKPGEGNDLWTCSCRKLLFIRMNQNVANKVEATLMEAMTRDVSRRIRRCLESKP